MAALSAGGTNQSSPESNSEMDEFEDDGSSIMAEINITPLTDVFLVLLVIFMVTSSVMSQMGVNVDLPVASNDVATSQGDGVVVTLKTGGTLSVNGTDVPAGDWPAFERVLKAYFKETTNKTVIIEGDREAYLGSTIEVMDYARRAGAGGFAIATKPSGS